jgi:large subunit ribosomal protein L6
VSRVGKKPISIPSGVQVGVEGSRIKVKGPKGELLREIDPSMSVKVSDGTLVVNRSNDAKFFKAMHGLYRSLINNMVTGVTRGFEKKLEIVGVGFKAEMKNKRLTLQIGYSHPIIFVPPPDINIACESPTMIAVSGVDKELVGQIAAKIRSFRPPEPYKGKGIKYIDEVVRRKAGKTAGS